MRTKRNVSTVVAAALSILSTAHIASAARLATVVKPGGSNSIVYWAVDGNIWELVNPINGGWKSTNLTVQSGGHQPNSQPTAYVRCDGVTSVVYRTVDGRMFAINQATATSPWVEEQLPIDVAAQSGSTPIGLCRPDGTNMVVFSGQDSHLHAVTRGPRAATWSPDPAFFQAGMSRFTVFNDPFGYIRSDGVTAVTWVDPTNAHVYELSTQRFQGWNLADLTAIADHHVPGGQTAAGYRRSDGVDAVVFGAAGTGEIWEFRLPTGGSQWLAASLNAVANGGGSGGSPIGYRRSDQGYNAVVYQNGLGQMVELSAKPGPFSSCPSTSPQCWHAKVLTTAIDVNSDPVGFASSFGDNWVIYVGTDQHVHRLSDPFTQSTWTDADLFRFVPIPPNVQP